MFKSCFLYSYRHSGFVARNRISKENKRFTYTRLSGVHKVIKKVFFPSYKYADAILAPVGTVATRIERAKKGTGAAASTKVNSSGKKDGRQRGKALGKLVMKQLKATVALYTKYSCSKRVFFDKKERLKFAREISDKRHKAAFISRCGSLNTYTEKIWSFLHLKGWNPVAVECPVGAVEHYRMGTAVDLVCMANTLDKQLVLVEIKAGYASYLHKHTHVPMNYPFGDKNDCPKHQHFIQTLVTADLYQRTHPGHNVLQAVVLRVDNECVDVEPLPSWMVERRAAVMNSVANRV